MKKARLRIMLATSGLMTLFACNALIGTRDLTYDPEADLEDGGGDTSHPVGNDGMSTVDAPLDTGACPGADLTQDGHNCGVCGHDCLGGACMGSKCQPVKVYADTVQTYAIAVDTKNLYFSDINAGDIYVLPKDAAAGSKPTKIATTTDPIIYDIVPDDAGAIFFSWGSSGNGGKLESIFEDGGARRNLMATDAAVARGVDVNSVNVYFALTDIDPEQVGYVARNATNAKPTLLSNNEPGADNLIVSGNNVYWGGENNTAVRFCNSDPTGCAAVKPANFVAGLNASEALGANTKNVFISGYDILYQAAKGSTTAAPIAQNQPQVFSIAADDKDIYWIDLGTNDVSFNNGSIRHCPIDSNGSAQCTVVDGEIIMNTDGLPRRMVMDAKAVYWSMQNEGAIYRLAR